MKWVFGTKEEDDISRLFILNDLNCCVASASQQMVIDNSFSINIDASLINNTSIIVMICLTSIHVLSTFLMAIIMSYAESMVTIHAMA